MPHNAMRARCRLNDRASIFLRKPFTPWELARRVSPYRAGYTAVERREIEAGLTSGRLLGAVATNALELGIDIGDLDATLLTGFPGSVASTVQQAGRSGRRGERSLSILIGQHRRHPDHRARKAPCRHLALRIDRQMARHSRPVLARAQRAHIG